MDRTLSFEEHLLKRSYTHDAQIQALLTTRYRGADEGTEPYLALVPTVADTTTPKEDTSNADFFKNHSRKPTASRRLNTRTSMKIYVKSTLANQKKAFKTVQQARKKSYAVNIAKLVQKYEIPKFETFMGLNGMWCSYMQDLLFGEQKNPNLNMVLPRLSTADYNGCLLTVLESRDRNLVGMQGIVVHDSQYTFILVVRPKENTGRTLSAAEEVGGMRVVAKVGTLFGFDVPVNDQDCIGFTIVGSRFQLRAVDRSAKKFKSHNVDRIC